jgi:hypothetical protein
MNADWQTWTALAIVATTAIVFIAKLLRRSKRGCGGGCCDVSPKSKNSKGD